MNDEKLEHHLRDLPVPPLPEGWQAEILSKARRAAEVSVESRPVWPPILVLLRNLFLRNPITATAMATLWILIFVFKASTPVDASSSYLLAHVDPQHPPKLFMISEEMRLAESWQEEPTQKQWMQIP